VGIEDPETDVAEQRRPATRDDDADLLAAEPGPLPLEADPVDVAEQRTELPDDDDDEPR
jgi:hypothetical protein